MVIKQLKLDQTRYSYSESVLITNFDANMLRVSKHDCGDRYVYHINYFKCKNDLKPFCLIISKVIGYIEEYKGVKYLNFATIEDNNNVLNLYNGIWNSIGSSVSNCNKIEVFMECDVPMDKLIKLTTMLISYRLMIEKDGKNRPEVYLVESYYDDYWANM